MCHSSGSFVKIALKPNGGQLSRGRHVAAMMDVSDVFYRVSVEVSGSGFYYGAAVARPKKWP
jgi:hypothetical protein